MNINDEVKVKVNGKIYQGYITGYNSNKEVYSVEVIGLGNNSPSVIIFTAKELRKWN